MGYKEIKHDRQCTHNVQGGSNMTGTICVQTSHSLSRSHLNHFVKLRRVHETIVAVKISKFCIFLCVCVCVCTGAGVCLRV